jgi:cystathionine beta-lyase/cystathionine gamma-synthase
MDPHQAWLVLRGVKTLALRIEKSQDNALELARFLKSHPKVKWVNYPDLEDYPQHSLAKAQMNGSGSMLCFGRDRSKIGLLIPKSIFLTAKLMF